MIAYGDALAAEVAPFGIRVLTLLPGGFYTTGGVKETPTLNTLATDYPGYRPISDYDAPRAQAKRMLKSLPGTQPGDLAKFAQVLVDVVKGEGVWEGREWPEGSRLVIGSDSERVIKTKIASMEKGMRDYKDVITFTDRPEVVQNQKENL